MYNYLILINKKLNTCLLFCAGLILISMMILACTNMIFRAVWVPVKGSFELMGMAGALAAGLAMAGTQQGKGHISVSMFAGKLSPFLEKLIIIFSDTLSAAFFGIIGWQVIALGFSLQSMGELSETLQWPYYPVVIVVGISALAVAFTLVIEIVSLFDPKSNVKPDQKLSTNREEC